MSSINTTNHHYSSAPLTGWSLFTQLLQGTIVPGLAWTHKRYRRKFLLRSLLAPAQTLKHLSRLAAHPQLEQILAAQPGLPCRLHRPWLAVDVSLSQKLSALQQHYQRFPQALPARVVDACLSERGATLATLQAKNEQLFTLRLQACPNQDKEGEITLMLLDAQNAVLAQITFTLFTLQNKSTLFIGGLQGAKSSLGHEAIQSATKDCHGLFPKRLVTEAVMAVGKAFSVEQIIAVSNSTHIYAALRYRRKKKQLFHADYDDFWQSLGGEKDRAGHFQLPLAISRKPMETIVSKKRAEYRRRYALLDQLEAQVALTCGGTGG